MLSWQGYPPLTKILASFFGKLLGQEIDPLKNVLVTVGAYGALFTAFQALVDEGDEVNGQSLGWVGVKGPSGASPSSSDLCTRLSSSSPFLTVMSP